MLCIVLCCVTQCEIKRKLKYTMCIQKKRLLRYSNCEVTDYCHLAVTCVSIHHRSHQDATCVLVYVQQTWQSIINYCTVEV